MTGRRILEIGGIVAGALMIAFGIGALVLSINARNTVGNEVTAEQIVGSADMSPAAITVAMKEAGLQNVSAPTCDVAEQPIQNGSDARCFAQYMRIHALEATGGQVYAQMGRYLDASGKPTNNDAKAAKDPKTGKPVENGARNLWVTETALSTALNTSYFAENVANFAIVMGVALLLTGIGFLVLTLGLVRVPFRRETEFEKQAPVVAAVPVTN
jgi:hypothetical protein